MDISRSNQFPEVGKTIGYERAGGKQMFEGPCTNGGPREVPAPGQTGPEGMPIFRVLDLRQKGCRGSFFLFLFRVALAIIQNAPGLFMFFGYMSL